MIKVGIYGSGNLVDPLRKQLLRLLLRHPDVDLRAVASPGGNTVPIAELHPVYAGETELTLERVLDLKGLDVLFVIDSENLTDEIMEKYRTDENFRLIVLGNADDMLDDDMRGLVYGLPEYFRKDLVRGARGAVSPRPEAIAIELALLPLAKNALLNSDIDLAIATWRPIDKAAAEARKMLGGVQPSLSASFNAATMPEAPYRRIDLKANIKTPIALEEIERIYRDTYDDHNFVYLIAGSGGVNEDLRGSNKYLVQLSKVGDTLTIETSMDAMTKGCAGNAVHIMDLLFGMHERTGLSI